jgi:hypothetical protein
MKELNKKIGWNTTHQCATQFDEAFMKKIMFHFLIPKSLNCSIYLIILECLRVSKNLVYNLLYQKEFLHVSMNWAYNLLYPKEFLHVSMNRAYINLLYQKEFLHVSMNRAYTRRTKLITYSGALACSGMTGHCCNIKQPGFNIQRFQVVNLYTYHLTKSNTCRAIKHTVCYTDMAHGVVC